MLIKYEMHYGFEESLIPEKSIIVIHTREKIIRGHLFLSKDCSHACVAHKYGNDLEATCKQKSVFVGKNSTCVHRYTVRARFDNLKGNGRDF
jgi:hypothetical protein